MLCPKCREYFEEGSRRFCPTDGARLVSEVSSLVDDRAEGGIFSNLIPKMEGIRDLEERPRFTVTDRASSALERESEPTLAKMEEMFFELDEFGSSRAPKLNIVKPPVVPLPPSTIPEPKSSTRKVNLHEIPKGHVDLEGVERLLPLAGEFDTDDPQSFIGQTVKGRYRVTEFLGGDESGLAYLADDKIVADRLVSVRVLTGDDVDEIMDSILAEERVSLSHFSHPNIARLIDSGQFTNGLSFLVTEYVDALSVADILTIHGKFPPQRTARIIRHAASALNQAHQEGILHRDVRPQNIIVDTISAETEQAILVNFSASTGSATPQNMRYKAHEILDGRIATVSSDIFSLAVVAYEMLTGRLPFSGSSPKELVRAQNAGLAGPSGELNRPVHEVFQKALALNTSDRYPKARDFGDALCAALAELEHSKPIHTVPMVAAAPSIVRTETLTPIVPAPTLKEPSPEPPSPPVFTAAPEASPRRPTVPLASEQPRSILAPVLGIIGLAALIAVGWYYVTNPPQPGPVAPVANVLVETNQNSPLSQPPAVNADVPPQPRAILEPPNSTFYQNRKENLKGDLVRNFVGFSLYYPKDWQVNGPEPGASTKSRGKFLDISRPATDAAFKEQLLVSYYPSTGTFTGDRPIFPALLDETNDALNGLPGYKVVSEGEITFNGGWKAYEIKFEADVSGADKNYRLYGRRLFVPAARPGVRNGFMLTLLATSSAADVRSADDLGVRGELASILATFEPAQNF